MTRRESITVAILFYLGWFGCVFLAKTSAPWFSLAFPLTLIVFLITRRQLRPKLLALACGLSILGIGFDSLLLNLGFIAAPGSTGLVIPVWLISIWFLFTLSILKLGNLYRISTIMGIVLGAIFGPLSYKSGEAFEVLQLTSSLTLAIYALFWGLMFPMVLLLAKRFE